MDVTNKAMTASELREKRERHAMKEQAIHDGVLAYQGTPVYFDKASSGVDAGATIGQVDKASAGEPMMASPYAYGSPAYVIWRELEAIRRDHRECERRMLDARKTGSQLEERIRIFEATLMVLSPAASR